MILTSRKERHRFYKFAIVGAVGAVVDFGVFNLLKLAAGLPTLPAAVISFVAAVLNNFIWNRYWTYPESKAKRPGPQLVQFAVVSTIGLGIRALTITPLETWIETNLNQYQLALPIDNHTIAANLSLALLIGLVMLWNYFVNRYWTYRDVVIQTGK